MRTPSRDVILVMARRLRYYSPYSTLRFLKTFVTGELDLKNGQTFCDRALRSWEVR